jgi:phosphomannomutase/phosphoglucomutase
MKLNEKIFREYDIRGTVDIDLSPDVAYTIGRAYATLAREKECKCIAVGWDCRLTSETYADSLSQGLSDEGLDVIKTGMGPTPQLYFAIFDGNLDGGIQVTGSHNPPEMNGFKLCLGKQTLSGDEIQDLYKRAVSLAAKAASAKKGEISTSLIQERYIHYLIENSKPFVGKRPLTIVVDGGNGVGGMVGPKVLKSLGYNVIELFCDPDGRFPNHHPDPTVLKNLGSLIAKVREVNADFGIGWDGDADRIGVVDNKGDVLFGDMLLLIYGREILKTEPNATIIGDVKCSSLLFSDLKARGGNPIMWKTGHSLIKKKLYETEGALGGEMSGHIFFKQRFFGFDDALYASCRFAEIVSNSPQAVSEMLADLPKMVSTPEIRLDCPEELKFKVAKAAKSRFPEYPVSTLDGVRITFENGWGLVRASNTQPVLVMRFEAATPALLEDYKQIVSARIEEIKKSL